MLWTHGIESTGDTAVHTDQAHLTRDNSRAPAQTGRPATIHPFDFRQLVGILRRRRRSILMIAFLGTLLAGGLGLLIPPKYTARAQLVVEPHEAAVVAGQSVDVRPMDESAIDTHVTMLMSHDHLKHVLASLLEDTEFQSPTSRTGTAGGTSGVAGEPAPSPPAAVELHRPEASTSELGELMRRLKIWIGPLARIGQRASLGIDELDRNLKIYQERRSRVITVSYTSASPSNAALVANRTAQLYVESRTAERRTATIRELARLDQRISELKSEVENTAAAASNVIQQRFGGAPSTDGPTADEQMRRLVRAAADSRRLHDNLLLRRQNEIRDRLERIAADIRMLSAAAVPSRPSSANPVLFIPPAMILFLLGGSLLAVLLDRLDRGLRSSRDIENALGIPCLGLVPQAAPHGGLRPYQLLRSDPFGSYAEAIRSIAASLPIVVSHRAPKLILVTSSLQREGKTTLATSLAVYAALLRERVLLLDLDFRQPAVQRELTGTQQPAKTGVLDLLLHTRSLAELVQRIPELGLDYLAMTPSPIDATLLFAGERLPRLLHHLRESYDCIVIDGPPLFGVTETRLLAAKVDKVLLAVKWGSTRRELAQHATELLLGSPELDSDVVDPLAAVVTCVNLKQHARYDYGDVAAPSTTAQQREFRPISPAPSEARKPVVAATAGRSEVRRKPKGTQQ